MVCERVRATPGARDGASLRTTRSAHSTSPGTENPLRRITADLCADRKRPSRCRRSGNPGSKPPSGRPSCITMHIHPAPRTRASAASRAVHQSPWLPRDPAGDSYQQPSGSVRRRGHKQLSVTAILSRSVTTRSWRERTLPPLSASTGNIGTRQLWRARTDDLRGPVYSALPSFSLRLSLAQGYGSGWPLPRM